MSRRELIGVVSMGVVAIVVTIMYLIGQVKLTDFITQLAVGLTLLLPVMGWFTLNPRLGRWLESKKHIKRMELPAQPIDFTPQDTRPDTTVTEPPLIDGKRHYENRSLPFDEMVYKVERRLEMSAITFRIMTYAYHRVLKGLLSRRVHITFLLLSPNSRSATVQSKIYHAGEDLEDQIQKSLKILCELKKEFNELVEIKLYDSISQHSIIIIDRDNADKAWIKVERRPVGSDSNSRPSDEAYRKDNEGFFNQYLSEYDALLGSSKAHECPNSS